MRACVTEGCGRNSYAHRVCYTCRYRANKDKACATEGCERKPGNSKHCPSCRLPAQACATEGCKRKPGTSKLCGSCRLPARAKRCGHCGMEAHHTRGQLRCFICQQWRGLGKRRGIPNTFTEFEFLRLLHEAAVCPDTGHVFDDCSSDKMMRKSPDRIDNAKGYEPGNVRVTTWRANLDRRSTPIDEWLPIAALRYKTNSKTLTSN
jgi:hypothetical protein